MSYESNKAASRTVNKRPTMTDQAAAKDTDRNVIVKKFMQHGQVPMSDKQPMYLDFTQMPEDLQGFLKQAQSVRGLRRQLPQELRDLTLDALMSLTPAQLREKLKKPDPPAKTEEPKK